MHEATGNMQRCIRLGAFQL